MSQNSPVILKTYNQPSLQQLSVCIVRFRHKDRIAKYRFLLVLEDGPALLRAHDIEMLEY